MVIVGVLGLGRLGGNIAGDLVSLPIFIIVAIFVLFFLIYFTFVTYATTIIGFKSCDYPYGYFSVYWIHVLYLELMALP